MTPLSWTGSNVCVVMDLSISNLYSLHRKCDSQAIRLMPNSCTIGLMPNFRTTGHILVTNLSILQSLEGKQVQQSTNDNNGMQPE